MTSASFRPHERIAEPGDFERAFARRRPASNEWMVVHAVENGLDHARLGISVGRRKMRRATDRNHVKRLIREAFRLNKDALPRGLDLIVVPRSNKLTFELACASLVELAKAAERRLASRPATPPRPPGSTP